MATLNDWPAGEAWIVTGQDPDQVIISASGKPVTGTYVYFATAEGNAGSIFADDGTYVRVKTVHRMLAVRAKLVDEIGRLTSRSNPG